MLDRTRPPHVYPIEGLRLPEVEKEVFPNNTELYEINGGSQDVNQLMLIFDGGKADCRVGVTAQLAAELMREGAGERTGGEMAEIFDFNGAILRISANGHHMIVSLLSMNDRTSQVLPLLKDILNAPAFKESDFINLRDKASRQMSLMQSRVDFLSGIGLNRLMMGAGNPMVGDDSPSDILTISLDDVKRFHSDVFVGRRCRAILAGKLSPELRTTIRQFLMEWGGGTSFMSRYEPFDAASPQIIRESLKGAMQASVSMGLPGPGRNTPDFLPVRNAVTALGGYFGSRLMTSIREEKGLTYGIGAYLLGYAEGSIITIGAQADMDYIDRVIDETAKELRLLGTEPMAEEELHRLRQNLLSSLVEILDSPFSIADFYKSILPFGIDPCKYFAQRAALAETLTTDSILEYSHKYFNPDLLRISVVG